MKPLAPSEPTRHLLSAMADRTPWVRLRAETRYASVKTGGVLS